MTPQHIEEQNDAQTGGTATEVLLAFLRVGCTSFGGPVAHIGYFRKEFVERRRWLSEGAYAELMALAHSLPGPASSQIGFSIGLLRAGWLGGLAAFLGFTLPSVLLMLALAYGHSVWSGTLGERLFHGLQLVAVAVVAQAVVAMRRNLAPDLQRLLIAVAAMAFVLLLPWPSITLFVILLAAGVGLAIFSRQALPATPAAEIVLPKSLGKAALVALLVTGILAIAAAFSGVPAVTAFAAFYRSGALVFGGGHVVLPLLEHAVVDRGWVSQTAFLAGYGAAQAVPGPLFSFAAYLGAAMAPANQRMIYGAASLAGIFLPGLLAMAAVLPFWGSLRSNLGLRAALLGVNASVVGILAAALVHPLWTSTVQTVLDVVVVVAAFALLHIRRVQPWMVVLAVAALSLFRS